MDCRIKSNVEQLYARTGRAAILKTARLVGRFDVAEEIVQSVFLKLWDARLSFESERSAYAWIYRACHNAGIDHVRSHATRFEAGVEPEKLGTHGRDDATIDAVAERQWWRERLSRFDEREAAVLAYRIIDGMTQQEIAEVMGVSRKTIVRLCAAIDAKLEGDA